MNTYTNRRIDRLREEMKVNPILQKVIAVHHIIQVVAILVCVGVSIGYLFVFIQLLAIFPIILFIIFWVASKCNFQDLVVILVHFNPLLSTIWFISVFPAFVTACIPNLELGMYSYYYYTYTVDGRARFVTVMTGILSLSSAIFAVMGIWKSARKVLLNARSGDRDPVNAVGSVPTPYEAAVTFTCLNGIPIPQSPNGQPMLTQ